MRFREMGPKYGPMFSVCIWFSEIWISVSLEFSGKKQSVRKRSVGGWGELELGGGIERSLV